MEKDIKLTELEIKIMRVLWESEHHLTIQEIGKQLEKTGISIASVAQSVKHLIKKKAVIVCEHVPVANVYARTFSPAFSQEEFLAKEIDRLQRSVLGVKKLSLGGITAALLKSDAGKRISVEEIEEFQQIMEARKEQLKREEG